MDYFNLNKRSDIKQAKPTWPAKSADEMGLRESAHLSPYSLLSSNGAIRLSGPLDHENQREGDADQSLTSVPHSQRMPVLRQLMIYSSLLIGVILSSGMLQLAHDDAVVSYLTVPGMLLSFAIALVTMPSIYKKIAKPDAIFFARFIFCLLYGAFWPILFEAISRIGSL